MALMLGFETKRLRDICRSEVIACRELPSNVAQVLIRRLADIRAASNILHLPVGKPVQTDGAPPGLVLVNLCDGYHLMFSAAHQQIPVLVSGDVNWNSVSRIKLIKIGGDDE